jgi:hypothetical protein
MFPDGLHPITTAEGITKSKLYERLMNPSVDITGHWAKLVENYAKCGLTKPTDKLIAFNCVAQAVMNSRGGRCIAGVWQDNIAYDLAWHRPDEAKELLPIDETSFRAPSWSWVCVDGPVYYPIIIGKIQRRFISGGIILEPDANQDASIYKHPYIRLQSRCLPLKIEWLGGEMVSFATAGFRTRLGDVFGAEIHLDGPDERAQELGSRSRVYWIPLFASTECLYGIVLAKVRGIHAYRRIGALEIPIIEAYTSDEVTNSNGRGGQIIGDIPSERSAMDAAVSERDFDFNQKWNMLVLQLVYRIDKLKLTSMLLC